MGVKTSFMVRSRTMTIGLLTPSIAILRDSNVTGRMAQNERREWPWNSSMHRIRVVLIGGIHRGRALGLVVEFAGVFEGMAFAADCDCTEGHQEKREKFHHGDL